MPSQKPPPPPTFWRSIAEYEDPAGVQAASHDEFPDELPLEPAAPQGPLVQLRKTAGGESQPPRRDFFRMMGLSATAAMAACNRAPKHNILPYTQRPEAVIPGLAVHYATSCQACPARCGLLVKTREGRPIKVEGNPEHPVSRGAVCAVGQASVLGLYDADRARGPRIAGQPATWAQVDARVLQALKDAGTDAPLFVVVPFGLGPSENAALDAFKALYPRANVVRFDALQERAAIAEAHQALFGHALLPDFRLERADVIVSFGADFLGTWLNPASFSRQWAQGRSLEDPIARKRRFHIQLESEMSLTGGAADRRHPLSPSNLDGALAAVVERLAQDKEGDVAVLARALARKVGTQTTLAASDLDEVASRLRAAGAAGLVLSGSDDRSVQMLSALANALLANHETTCHLAGARHEASDASWEDTLQALANGASVLFWGTNPAMADRRLIEILPKARFSVSTSSHWDETARACTVHAPEGHAFESWSDAEPRAGVFVVNQPTVSALFDTRSRLASLLLWCGRGENDHDFVTTHWQEHLIERAGPKFLEAWNERLRRGFFERSVQPSAPKLAETAMGVVEGLGASPRSAGIELRLHASLGLGDGSHANNGWLQELPDPITKLTWGNAAALGPALAKRLGVKDGDHVALSRGAVSVTLPVLVQAGTAPETIALAVGHGRAQGGSQAAGHGVDAWPLASGERPWTRAGSVSAAKAPGRSPLSLAQVHNSQEGRAFVRQASLDAYLHDPKHAGHPEAHPELGKGLWKKHPYEGHRWAMAIDLDKCTGCGACVVSCQAENNVPVVGPEEVALRRDMHWLRIDRYYGGSPENPEVLHQPMMCQHCENAPCETVCPVLATMHSSEGLNQQIYNRCVGTRYCANNCPTKVRRFNWFDYPHDEPLARMVLNPDVVVRTRGVMEKCSMCVHRIEEARARTKREGGSLTSADVQTACQQSCPGQAIFFGDANDPRSAVAQAAKQPRAYKILTEINIGPSVSYLVRLKNDRHG